MSAEVSVAAIALIVSLIALFVASGQLLGQMFATADGYRRCQYSVIGSWAEKTRLVWHWSQFRFETKFTTPEIVLYDDLNFDKTASSNMCPELKRKFTMENVVDLKQVPFLNKPLTSYPGHVSLSKNNDAVTWLAFLHQLSVRQDFRLSPMVPVRAQPDTRVGIIYRERTWDLMPPDVSLPVASSRLGVIVVLALRLGMTWENLDLSNGFLRATGNGHTLISTTIRGLGITFQYTFTDDLGPMQNDLLPMQPGLPNKIDPAMSKATDLVRCGIVPGCPKLGILSIPLAGETLHEKARYLRVALQYLGVAEQAIKHLTRHKYLEGYQTNSAGNEISLAINDMIALCSERWPDLDTVPWPLETNVVFSSFLFYEFCEKYYKELEKRAAQTSASDHLKSLAEKMLKIRTDSEPTMLMISSVNGAAQS